MVRSTEEDRSTSQPQKISPRGARAFFSVQEAEGKKVLAPEYIENQKAVDAALTSGLDATVKSYLGSRFTLKSGDR